MVRNMIIPIFIFAVFLWPCVTGGTMQSILSDRGQFDLFFDNFQKYALKTGKFSENVEQYVGDLMESLQTTITTKTGKQTEEKLNIMMSAITSVLADSVIEDDQNTTFTINERMDALQWALRKTYEKMGLEKDNEFLQNIESLVTLFQENKEKEEDKTIAVNIVNKVATDENQNFKTGMAFDINLMLSFEFRLLSQLKAAGEMDRINYMSITNSNLLTLAQLVAKNLGVAFNIKIEAIDINNLYNILVGINVELGNQAYYNALADFTANMLAKHNVLSDSDITVGMSLQAISTAISQTFPFSPNVDLDTSLTVGIQEDINAKISAGLTASGVIELLIGVEIDTSDLYYFASLLVTNFNVKFNLNLDVSYVQNLFAALIQVKIDVDINAFLSVIVDFTTQILIKFDLLTGDTTEIINLCFQIILISFSESLNLNIDLNVALETAVNVAIETSATLDVSLDQNVNVDLDTSLTVGIEEDINAKISAGLTASGIIELLIGVEIDTSALYYFAGLLVTNFNVKFNLNLDVSYVQNLYAALIQIQIDVDINAFLSVIVDFTTQILIKFDLLTGDTTEIINLCFQIILLSFSDALNIDIDLSVALQAAVSIVAVGVDADTEESFDSGIDVSDTDTDLLIDFLADFGQALQKSDEFDSAFQSQDKESVLLSIFSVLQSLVGEDIANYFASSIDL